LKKTKFWWPCNKDKGSMYEVFFKYEVWYGKMKFRKLLVIVLSQFSWMIVIMLLFNCQIALLGNVIGKSAD
jgi:hypothetical protein